jgi:hypothetical protein
VTEFWQIAERSARFARVEKNLNFYVSLLQKFMYDGPQSMRGLLIPVRLNLDLSQILDRTLAVCSQLDSRVVAKSAESKNTDFTSYMDALLYGQYFQMGKSGCES